MKGKTGSCAFMERLLQLEGVALGLCKPVSWRYLEVKWWQCKGEELLGNRVAGGEAMDCYL